MRWKSVGAICAAEVKATANEMDEKIPGVLHTPG